MPATVTDDPLAISCVFSDGSTARFQLDDLPCRQLVADLLIGLVELIHPHGTSTRPGRCCTTSSPFATLPVIWMRGDSPVGQRI